MGYLNEVDVRTFVTDLRADIKDIIVDYEDTIRRNLCNRVTKYELEIKLKVLREGYKHLSVLLAEME